MTRLFKLKIPSPYITITSVNQVHYSKPFCTLRMQINHNNNNNLQVMYKSKNFLKQNFRKYFVIFKLAIVGLEIAKLQREYHTLNGVVPTHPNQKVTKGYINYNAHLIFRISGWQIFEVSKLTKLISLKTWKMLMCNVVW